MRSTRVVRVLYALVSLVLLGFISDFISARPARNHAARAVADSFAESGVQRPVTWVPSAEVADFYAARPEERENFTPEWRWRARIFGATLYFPTSEPEAPWAYVRSEPPRFPFVSAVSYGFVARPRYGHCGFRLYANFFGLVFPVKDWPTSWT